jgi:hypothetical protein
MALNIKDPALLAKIEHLSRVRRMSKVDVLRAALEGELEKDAGRPALKARLAPLIEKVAAASRAQPASWEEDKRRSDELWGE